MVGTPRRWHLSLIVTAKDNKIEASHANDQGVIVKR